MINICMVYHFLPCKLQFSLFFVCWVIWDYILNILNIMLWLFCVLFKSSSEWFSWVQGMCSNQLLVGRGFSVSSISITYADLFVWPSCVPLVTTRVLISDLPLVLVCWTSVLESYLSWFRAQAWAFLCHTADTNMGCYLNSYHNVLLFEG